MNALIASILMLLRREAEIPAGYRSLDGAAARFYAAVGVLESLQEE